MADNDPEKLADPSRRPPFEQSPSRQNLEWHDGDMPYSAEFGDHFYCRTDGRLECGHVFLAGNDLPQRWSTGRTFTIGELGFGTGLNLCETVRQWRATRGPVGTLHFVSFERFPMQAGDIGRALSHWPEIERERMELTAAWPMSPTGTVTIDFDERTRLSVVCGIALDSIERERRVFDAWFLDGFAPSRNPDMWSQGLMSLLFGRTAPGGTFATYAAAGFVRRNLQAAGFSVERRQGFAGKREMLCGTKPAEAA